MSWFNLFGIVPLQCQRHLVKWIVLFVQLSSCSNENWSKKLKASRRPNTFQSTPLNLLFQSMALKQIKIRISNLKKNENSYTWKCTFCSKFKLLSKYFWKARWILFLTHRSLNHLPIKFIKSKKNPQLNARKHEKGSICVFFWKKLSFLFQELCRLTY